MVYTIIKKPLFDKLLYPEKNKSNNELGITKSGSYLNYDIGLKAEHSLYYSLKNPNSILIMGSSEIARHIAKPINQKVPLKKSRPLVLSGKEVIAF